VNRMADAESFHSIDDYRTAYENGERLRGFRSACGFVTATWGLACPRCGQRDLAELDLPTAGRLVAFTVQNVPGDEFLNEAPYAYVVVDLDGGGRITGWMEGIREPSQLAVGASVRWSPSYKPGVRFALEQPSSSPSP
jgi:uncharacterized OB-fold protein